MEFNSLIDFFENDVLKFYVDSNSKNILEVGCGSSSLFEQLKLSSTIWAIDKSVDAILNAPAGIINYQAASIENYYSDKKFDLIIDTHAIHCIEDFSHREMALKNIYNHLTDNGLFASEMMVMPGGHGSNVNFTKRLILNALDVERELLQIGFKIKFFMIRNDLYFLESTQQFEKCDLLRLIASK